MGIDASSPLQHLYFSKKELSDCFNGWNNNQRTDNARDQLDSDVAMDKFDQLNAAAHNTKGVLLIWNMLLYNIIYFADLTTLYYIDLDLFLYTEWRSCASSEKTTWSTNGWFLCTHSFWCFAVSNIEFNTYSWINYLRFECSVWVISWVPSVTNFCILLDCNIIMVKELLK